MSEGLKVETSATPLPSKGQAVKSKWMKVGIGIMLVVIAWGILMGDPPKPKNTGNSDYMNKIGNTEIPKGGLEVTPKNMTQQSWQAQSQLDLRTLNTRLATLESQQSTLKQENTRLQTEAAAARNPRAGFTGTVPPPPTPDGVSAFRNSDVLGNVGTTAVAPLPAQAGLQNQSLTLPPIVVGTTPLEPPVGRNTTRPRTFEAPEITGTPVSGSPPGNSSAIEAKVSYKKNEFSGYITAGAWAEGVLLHGADLGAGAAVQSNPQPLLVMFKNNAQLPGSERYRLKGCLIIVTGYADLSAERGILRGGRLSCIDKSEKLVLTAQVEVYVVDSDGKFGIRGKLVDRQGAKLAKSLLAGFAQGIASMYGNSQGTLISSPLIGTSTTIQGGDAFKAAGLQGATQAATQLSQFYLQQAQSIYPVLEIEAERKVNIVFSNGAQLVWKSMVDNFETELTPQANTGFATIPQNNQAQVMPAPQQPVVAPLGR